MFRRFFAARCATRPIGSDYGAVTADEAEVGTAFTAEFVIYGGAGGADEGTVEFGGVSGGGAAGVGDSGPADAGPLPAAVEPARYMNPPTGWPFGPRVGLE